MSLLDVRPDHLQIVQDILHRHVPQYEVWAFGSRAKWMAKDYSDLDLCIKTDEPLGFDVLAQLQEDFTESDLPWKVDVVDWAVTSTSFRQIIERDKVVVQEANCSLRTLMEWRKTFVGNVFEVNPWRPLKRGSVAAFIPMEVLPPLARKVARISVREYLGSGMRFQNGDTLIARITPCLENGKTVFVSGLREDEVAHGSTEYIVLSAKGVETDSLFGYYLARTPEFRRYAISHMEGTSGRQRVSSAAIENFPVFLPPVSEQRAIAHILGTLDDKIEHNMRMNQTLEAMARALFKSWFVDFDGVPPENMQKSELGLIPKGWRIGDLSEILEIVGGGTPKTNVAEYWDGDIPWFSVVDTPPASDLFVTMTEKSITQLGMEVSSVRLIPMGTTIISARGTVGNLALAGRDMTFNQSCYGLKGRGGAGDYFVFLSSQRMVSQLHSMAHGSVFATITRRTFDAIRVAIPPADLLHQFEQRVEGWFDRILLNVQQSQGLAQLRDTILPKLIAGELRIKDAHLWAGKTQ